MSFMLWLARLFDRSAYRCLVCTRIRRGVAIRVCSGWACSSKCFEYAHARCLIRHSGDGGH